MITTIHIVNGPNLNLLGRREPAIYGTTSFDQYFESLKAGFPDIRLTYMQSNHEGVLIDTLHQFGFIAGTGIVLNAGAYAHTSIALRDAVAAIDTPVIEVHISAIYQRELFRHHSFLTDVCHRHFTGFGLDGYKMAIECLLQDYR